MNNRLINWFKYASPQSFYPIAGKMIPWFWALAAIFGIAGLYVGFLVAPTDAQQGEGYRIIFLHVPAAWMSMFIYLVMAFWAALGLAFNTRLSGMMASALAPTGALFTFLALWTGALWGKPMWGAWWVWEEANADTNVEDDDDVFNAKVSARYREMRMDFLVTFMRWYRDLFMIKSGGGELIHFKDKADLLKERAERLTLAQTLYNVNAVEELARQFDRNLNEESVLAYAVDRIFHGVGDKA